MGETLEILGGISSLPITLVVACALLGVILISVVYLSGYIYDALLWKLTLRIGQTVSRYCPRIKKNSFITSLWRRIQPKEMYLRYETPILAYCFSYTGIDLMSRIIMQIFAVEYLYAFIVAALIYLLLYFIGMARKYESNGEHYNEVLENNMNFLKLSFLPLGFVVTVLGFVFTVGGLQWKDFSPDLSAVLSQIVNWYVSMMEAETGNLWVLLLKLVLLGVTVIIMFYILSLPIQVMAYFFVMVIQYFRKYKKPYSHLARVFRGIVGRMLRSI